ncbi:MULTISPECIES: pectate lyase [Prochlorococcus]|uniref:pectate lyase n=1 Tax=Prochlorococcus TaxID=1218 RepID=UPI0005337CEC|nr:MULTISPECIES: pectate lyase [Prochlorococcus]KGG11903.1 hypothetical protein EV05_1104 [Prochlorococcus sp. MIT 0601]
MPKLVQLSHYPLGSVLANLNPFAALEKKKIRTPWGNLKPKVDLFPVIYLIIIYGFIYILPYGKYVVGMSWFDWLRSEDGPLENMQFLFYLLASIFAFLTARKKLRDGINLNSVMWLLLALLCLFIAGEEISWGERITGFGSQALRDINSQGESNIHNLPFFHHILLDPSFEISCILFGWIGWHFWPKLDFLPKKRYSLYFLFVALFFFYFDISYSSTIKQIRNDQEIFEFLMSLGLLLHCWSSAIARHKNRKLDKKRKTLKLIR